MARKKTGQEGISEKLHEAIDGLRKDVTRVEVWATALSTFSQRIPDYRPDARFELGRPLKTESLAENDNQKTLGTDRRKQPD